MHALVLEATSGPDGLRYAEVDAPSADGGLVLIDVHAAGVGFVDLLLTRGEYQIRPELPFVPGIEAAGVVRSAPPDAGVVPGDRVAAATAFGAFAEVAAVPPFLAFPIPDEMDFVTGAALVVNYQTAHLALVRRGRLKAGEAVLVHGAGGGVGIASIQVARALGAGRIIAVASSRAKRDAALDAGADEAVDATGDWVDAVRDLTDGRGANVVVDPVGGDRFDASLKCMATEGRLLVIGFADGRIPQLPVNRLLLRHLDVVGVNWGGMLPLDQTFVRAAAADLFRWFEEGTIAPIVGKSYPLAQGAQALRDLAARSVVGKPVLTVD